MAYRPYLQRMWNKWSTFPNQDGSYNDRALFWSGHLLATIIYPAQEFIPTQSTLREVSHMQACIFKLDGRLLHTHVAHVLVAFRVLGAHIPAVFMRVMLCLQLIRQFGIRVLDNDSHHPLWQAGAQFWRQIQQYKSPVFAQQRSKLLENMHLMETAAFIKHFKALTRAYELNLANDTIWEGLGDRLAK